MALGFLWAARDYARAGAWYQQASEQALALANPVLRARSLNRLANWLVNTGSVAEGLQAHQTALGIFAEQHDVQGIAQTHDLLGITYGVCGDRIKATEQLGLAIDPHYIMIDLEFASTDEASKVAAALRPLWTRVEAEGLIGGQQLRILEVVENKEY